MYNGDPKPFNASNQHGSRPFPGAGVVMTFSPVVNRKPGAKPMAPKGLMINTNHALASLRTGEENRPPQQQGLVAEQKREAPHTATNAAPSTSVMRQPLAVMSQLQTMQNEMNQAREWIRKVSGGEMGTQGPYFSPCRAKGPGSGEGFQNHPLYKELMGDDVETYSDLFAMRTTSKGQNEGAQLRAQMMKYRQAIQELVKKRESAAEHACKMDCEFAKREKAYKQQVATLSGQVASLQATAESSKSAAQGTMMTLQEVAAERDDLRSQLTLANEKIEEAEGKINEEMAAQMEQEIENVKLQLADAKAELEKRDGEIAALEQDKVELAAASEIVKAEKLQLAESNASVLKEICDMKERLFKVREENGALTRQIDDVKAECKRTVERLRAELMDELNALEAKDQEMNAEKALLEAEVARLGKESTSLRDKASAAEAGQAKLEADLDRVCKEGDLALQSLNADKDRVSAELASEREALCSAKDKLEAITEQLQERNAQVEQATADLANKQEEATGLRSAVEQAAGDLSQLRADAASNVAKLQGSVDTLEAKLDELTAESSQRTAQLEAEVLEKDAEIKVMSAASAEKVASLEAEAAALESRIQQLQASITSKEEELAAAAELQAKTVSRVEELEATAAGMECDAKASAELQAQTMQRVQELEGDVAAKVDQIEELEGTVKSREASIEELEGTVKSREASIEELETRVSERDSSIQELKTDAEAKDAYASKLQGEVEELVAQGGDLSASLATAKSDISKLEGEVETLKTSLSEAEEVIDQAKGAQTRWLSEKDGFEATIASKSAHIDKLGMQIEEAAKVLSGVRADAAAEQKRLESSLGDSETMAKELNGKVAQADEKIAQFEAKLADMTKTLGDTKAALTDMTAKHSSTSDVLASTSDELTCIRSEREALTARVKDVEITNEEQRTELAVSKAQLEERAAALKDAHEDRDEARTGLATATAERDVARGQADELRARIGEKDEQLVEMKESVKKSNEELEKLRNTLQQDLQRSREEARQIQHELDQVKLRASESSASLEAATSKMQSMGMEIAQVKDELAKAEARYDQEHKARVESAEHLAVVEAEYRTYKTVCNTPGQLAEQLEKLVTLEAERASTGAKIAAAEEDLASTRNTASELREEISTLRRKLLLSENARRKLHNELQELKGNVRVFIRVRPGSDESRTVVDVDEELGTVGLPYKGDFNAFTFDRTFSPRAGQEDMFNEVSAYVQSALDGYNVSLFAYGQTGSGKTHTMFGSNSDQGIIPRSIDQILATVAEQSDNGWEYTLDASFLEIYNEQVRDLLCSAEEREGKKYNITQGENGRNDVSDVVTSEIVTHDDVMRVISIADKNRTIAKTDMNEHSSRSHTVFSLRITAIRNTVGNKQVLHGTLHLVDLAGSERLAKSHATGDRLKETQSINKSLSALSDVFVAISKKQAHVPYRNSKLTYLLQPCLSGDGKALVIANLSPIEESSHESLCTLRFASLVSSCELGKATKHVATTGAASAAAPAQESQAASAAETPRATRPTSSSRNRESIMPAAPATSSTRTNKTRESLAPSIAGSARGAPTRAASRASRHSVAPSQTPSKDEGSVGRGKVFGMMTPGGTLAPN